MITTPEMRAAAHKAWKDTVLQGKSADTATETAITADLALLPGDQVCHLVWRQARIAADDVQDYYEVARLGDKSVDGSDPFPVYASPAPLPVAVKVKPLGWVSIGEVIFASTPFGSYEIRPNRTSSTTYPLELVVPGEKTATRFFYFEDKAKAAAQADYETRIRSALFPTPSSDIAALREENERLLDELKKARREANDNVYMAHAYRVMLGPIASELAKKWEDYGVVRQHTSWGPDAHKLTGEERAKVLLDAFVPPPSALQHVAKGERGQ